MRMRCGSFWGFLEGHQRSQLSISCPANYEQDDGHIGWPTGDMQHALSLAHTKSDCCTQNQKSPTNLLSIHKFKVDAHKFELLHTKWVLQHTNSDLLHTKFCCSTQIEACCIQSGCCSMQRALLLLLCLLSLPIN